MVEWCVCVTGADNRAEGSPEALPEPSCPLVSTLLSRPEAGQGHYRTVLVLQPRVSWDNSPCPCPLSPRMAWVTLSVRIDNPPTTHFLVLFPA